MAGLEKYLDGKERLIIEYGDKDRKHTVIPDGAVLRVPLMLADSAIRQHILRDSDDVSPERAYQARKQHIAGRWRDHPDAALAQTSQSRTQQTMPMATSNHADYHEARLHRLQNAWKADDAKVR